VRRRFGADDSSEDAPTKTPVVAATPAAGATHGKGGGGMGGKRTNGREGGGLSEAMAKMSVSSRPNG